MNKMIYSTILIQNGNVETFLTFENKKDAEKYGLTLGKRWIDEEFENWNEVFKFIENNNNENINIIIKELEIDNLEKEELESN